MEAINSKFDQYDNGDVKTATLTAVTSPYNSCSQDNGDSDKSIIIPTSKQIEIKTDKTEITRNEANLKLWIFYMPEILEYLFKSVSNQDLKKFRLVNNTWNREACRILRRTSHCHLRELNDSNVTDFMEIFDHIKKTGAPSPFRRYYISAEALQNEFVDFLNENSDIHIIHLNLRKAPAMNNSDYQRNLHKILTKHGKTIEYFRCALRYLISLSWTSTSITNYNTDKKMSTSKPNQRLFLPSLKDFGFWEHDEAPKDSCLDFITNTINSSPNLTHLCPGSFDENVLPHILNNCYLKHIQDLYILFITDVHITALAQADLPQLRTLTVQVTPRSSLIRRSESMQQMVSNFASTLQNLTISWFSSSPDEDFPTCPKLESLIIGSWSGAINVFDSNRLPRLKKLHVQDLELSNFEPCPHHGVEEFVYESTEENLPYETMEEHEGFIEFISCQYPGLKSLDLTTPLSDEIVRAVVRNFPLLETFIMDTDYALSENIFTGINMYTLRRLVNIGGTNIDSIIRTPSLRDLKRLKTLVIGRYSKSRFPHGLLLTNNAIRFGLALMPSLQVLQLNWNPELSIVCLWENLSHLTKIIVNNSHSYERYDALVSLKEIMPQVDLDIPKHESHLDKRHDRLMLSSDY